MAESGVEVKPEIDFQSIIDKEREARGPKINIPEPSPQLIDILTRLEAKGISTLHPHMPVTDYPGYYPFLKFNDYFAQGWIIFDSTKKPDYKDGKQTYPNDPFSEIIRELREKGKIQTIKGLPLDSRFGISLPELRKFVFPSIARFLNLEGRQVRLPTLREFYSIGKKFYPELGDTDTGEWLEEKTGRLNVGVIGGRSDHGGFDDVDMRPRDSHNLGVGFRVVIDLNRPWAFKKRNASYPSDEEVIQGQVGTDEQIVNTLKSRRF